MSLMPRDRRFFAGVVPISLTFSSSSYSLSPSMLFPLSFSASHVTRFSLTSKSRPFFETITERDSGEKKSFVISRSRKNCPVFSPTRCPGLLRHDAVFWISDLVDLLLHFLAGPSNKTPASLGAPSGGKSTGAPGGHGGRGVVGDVLGSVRGAGEGAQRGEAEELAFFCARICQPRGTVRCAAVV